MRPHTSVAWQPTLSHDGGQSSGASRMTSRLSPSGGIRAIRSAATPAGIGQLWWISPARIGRHSVAPAVFLTSDGAGGSIIPMRDAIVKARSEEHTSELQSLMRISYAVFCLKKKT